MKKVWFLFLALFLISFTTTATPRYKYKAGSKKKMHLCHNNRYNNRPHAPGKAGNYKHDVSRYYAKY